MLVRLQPHPSASVRPSHNDPMELGKVIDALYDSEINCSVSTFWDGGFTVKLGDEMKGFLAERDCKTSHEAAEYLDQAAREHYPESTYALGKDASMACPNGKILLTNLSERGYVCGLPRMFPMIHPLP